jgi:Concanavalin A-like lectin/glucanases superfamily
MQALDRKFLKTYESSATKHSFKYTATVRHKGTVIAFAMDDQQRIYYTVLDLDRTTDPTRSQSGTTQLNTQLDVNCWSIEPQELRFPTEIEQVGYRVALQTIPRFRKSGLVVQAGENPDAAEIDGFRSTTARFTEDAPIQVLSDEKYIYVFRQAIAANHELNLFGDDKKKTKIVDNTLLLDRFVYADGKLSQKMEVRYQRSRNKDLPASRKDALGYTDLEKKPFYEPTQELSLIRNLTAGQFSIVLVPTALPDVQRWQIFAYNSKSKRMDCFSIERSSDGLFNTRGTRYYTSADPKRRKEVFERQPVDPATGDPLVPIVSEDGYAESALKFDGVATSATIPTAGLDFAQQDFTIELWVQAATSNAPECALLEQRAGNGFSYSIRYFQSGAKAGKIWVGRSDGTKLIEITSTHTINNGQFHHIAVIRTPIKNAEGITEVRLRLLIDGQASGTAIDTINVTKTEAPIYLGSRDGTTDFFTGTIDEVRMWQRGRSIEELIDDKYHRLIGNEPGLVGYWRFDEGSGGTAYDQTDFINHARLTHSQWILSEAPIGDHPGVRRSSFALSDRTFTAGCAALLYYQQEQSTAGYSDTEKKPIKRSARVMLAMTTGDQKGKDARNYIAVMDFAVTREGTIAQVPDLVELKAPEGTAPQNASLDELSKLENAIKSQKAEINEINIQLEGLRQNYQTLLQPTKQIGVLFSYQHSADNSSFMVDPGVGQFGISGRSIKAYKVERLRPWAAVEINGQMSSGGRYSRSFNGPLDTSGWVNLGPSEAPLANPTLTLKINESYDLRLDAASKKIDAKTNELRKLEGLLQTNQDELVRIRESVTKTVSLPMAFLHTDAMGFTILGSLLTFAWTQDAPMLFESVDGRVSLYFRGEADQFFAAYYNVVTGRASFRLPPTNSTLLFTARTSGSAIKDTEITIAPTANPNTCNVTIINSILKAEEVWNQVPRNAQDFAAVLNGTAQPVYVGKLLRNYKGEVNQINQIDLDGQRSQLKAGAMLLVGEAQTKVTIVKTEPMFEGAIGFKGQALEFDGEKDYVQIPDAQTLGLTNNSFTIEAWVSISDFQGKNNDRPILGTDDPAQRIRDKFLQAIVREGSPRLGFFENDTPGKTPLKPNVWYHLTWRYDKAKQEQAIFINGDLDASLTGRTPFSGTGRLTIGRCNGDRYFKGFIGEVRIWNEARSEADIRADMSRPFSERSPKLTACWRFVFTKVVLAKVVSDKDNRDSSRIQLIAKDYATDNSDRNGIVMGNPQLTAIGDHSRVQIQAINLTADENESVYLLPYDYAVHAQNKSAQVGGSLNNGSRLVSVESQNPEEIVVDGSAKANEIGPDCRWFADSQGNALNLDANSKVAPAKDAAAFAVESDCTLETWINPITMPETVSVVRQYSIPKNAETSQYHLKLIPETESPSAFEFDGMEDWIETPRSLSEIGFSKSFEKGGTTIEARIYIMNAFPSQYILSTESRGGDVFSSMSLSILSKKLQFRIGGSLVKEHYKALELNTWYSVACTTLVEGSTLRVNTFVDGDRDPQETIVRRADSAAAPDSSTVVLGASHNYDTGFRGRIGEVRLWNRVRTNEEIKLYMGRHLPGRDDDLASYWHFQDRKAKDYSGRGNHGVVKGNMADENKPQATVSLAAYRVWFGVGAQALESRDVLPCNTWSHLAMTFNQSYGLRFDGRESRVDCGTERTLDITDNLTIEIYLMTGNLDGKRGLVHKGKQGEGMPYALFMDGNQLKFTYEDEKPSDNPSEFKAANRSFDKNTFYRIAITREKRTETEPPLKQDEAFNPERHKRVAKYDIVYYVQQDNETKDIGKFTRTEGARNSPAPCQIGSADDGSSFDGTIAEVRIWNATRRQSELFTEFPGTEKGLVSWWQFEENQGNIAYDSKSSNHGTRIGATWVKSPDPNGSQLRLYVNGERQLTRKPAEALESIDPQFTIGKELNNAECFQGQLDELRIWKTVRTEEQVQDNLFRRLMGDFEQLIAYYTCDANKELNDESGRALNLPILAINPKDAFTISTAPISNETAKVRSALAGVKTDFHDLISSTPGVQEYGDRQYDSEGNLIGVMKRCYSYIQSGKWQLISGFKVGDLELEWIGQAQYEPQLVGFIEGAPPVPSENLTVRNANAGEIYDEVSVVELTEADRMLYSYAASKEEGWDFSLQARVGVGLKSSSTAGMGFATTVEESVAFTGGTFNMETSGGWLNEKQTGLAIGTNRVSRLNMIGNWEDPNAIQYPAIGRRYVPKNTGFALVKSKTADIFAMRLKHRNPEKRVTVALTLRANPDIPEDWNIITFPINPRYTKQGTLDGRVGLSPDKKDYPNAKDSSNDRSYFKPIEAYALKNRIEKEQQKLATDHHSYSVAMDNSQKALDEQEKLRKRLPTATQMNLFNTYVWTAEGGLFAETQNTMSTKQEVLGSNFSMKGMAGGFFEGLAAVAKGAVMFELEALAGGHLNVTNQRSQTSENGFEVNVTVDIERDITVKNQYGADGDPVKCAGKVDGYRFMTFYLQPDKEHFRDFSNKVVDRIWLEQSRDANAAALRQAIAKSSGTPWRVLHRVTYVSRVLPELAAEGSIEESLRAANLESNWELIQQLDPYVKSRTGSYAELRQAVEETLDRYLPELSSDAAKKTIVEYMRLYYQVFDR